MAAQARSTAHGKPGCQLRAPPPNTPGGAKLTTKQKGPEHFVGDPVVLMFDVSVEPVQRPVLQVLHDVHGARQALERCLERLPAHHFPPATHSRVPLLLRGLFFARIVPKGQHAYDMLAVCQHLVTPPHEGAVVSFPLPLLCLRIWGHCRSRRAGRGTGATHLEPLDLGPHQILVKGRGGTLEREAPHPAPRAPPAALHQAEDEAGSAFTREALVPETRALLLEVLADFRDRLVHGEHATATLATAVHQRRPIARWTKPPTRRVGHGAC